nr:hypothetical protein [Dendronalium sp. ChiSLP03b]MDZ8207346.1 hypothetical protein [Dendronalium sp. ChiSLP03b]
MPSIYHTASCRSQNRQQIRIDIKSQKNNNPGRQVQIPDAGGWMP